jgi:DHA2 family methylenomycin A resistance protein-like MFS transporter
MTAARTTPRTDPGAAPTPGARTALAIGSLGFFLITLDILIVNVALPRIGRELGEATSGKEWVIDGYTLLFASLLLFAGNLSDRIGAKRAIALGIAGFAATSAACALAPSLGTLIAARCAQGASAAIMLPASMALIRDAFHDPVRRARALGVWAVGGAMAGAMGPLAGGLLTMLSWRLVFGINLPVCAAMLVLLRKVRPSPTRPSRFDWLGQITAVAALSGLIYALIEGGSLGFASPPVLAAAGIAVLAGAALITVEAKGRHPMMPLSLFSAREMRIAMTVGFAFMVSNFGTVFLVSLFLQQHLGLTPLTAGLLVFPTAIFSIAGNLLSGPITVRFGTRVPVVAGMCLMTLGVLGMAATAPLGSAPAVTALLVLTGAGGSVAMPSVTGLVLASVPQHLAGTASGVFNTFRQMGGAVAIAVFGTMITQLPTFVIGMQVSLGITACLLIAAAVTGLRIRRPATTRA